VTEKPKRKFLKKPRLGGGREWLREFLHKNLQYPEEAREKGIEGDVIVRFKVNEQGQVLDPKVVNGPGYGCDEEAVRLVGMLRYDAVKNRGVKVTTNNRIKIPFRLNRQKKTSAPIRVTYTPAKKSPAGEKPGKPEKALPPKATYGYTIQIGPKPETL
jgi:TonB family protein